MNELKTLVGMGEAIEGLSILGFLVGFLFFAGRAIKWLYEKLIVSKDNQIADLQKKVEKLSDDNYKMTKEAYEAYKEISDLIQGTLASEMIKSNNELAMKLRDLQSTISLAVVEIRNEIKGNG